MQAKSESSRPAVGSSPDVGVRTAMERPDSPLPPPASSSSSSSSLPELRLVLLGRKGAGKSSAGNTILGEKAGGLDSGRPTEECARRRADVSGRRVTVVDTPGWEWYYPLNSTPDWVRRETARSVSLCPPGPHAVLLVVRSCAAVTEAYARQMEEHLAPLGSGVWDHAMVLFTRGDELGLVPVERRVLTGGPTLRGVLQRCGGRYHVLDNRDRGDGSQVRELLAKVEAMVAEAGRRGGHGHLEADGVALQGLEADRRRRARERRKKQRQMEAQTQRGAIRAALTSDGSQASGVDVRLSFSKGSRRLPELRLVLLGERETGKSSTGNTILGGAGFQTGAVTEECARRQAEVAMRLVTVVDAPGWEAGVAGPTPERVKRELVASVALCPPGPHAVLLALRVDTLVKVGPVREHLELLGEGVWRHTLLLFTHGDQLREGVGIEQRIQSGGKDLQWLMEKCRGRYHVISNGDGGGGGGGGAPAQVTELLEKVERMASGNRCEAFSGLVQEVTDLSRLKNERFSQRLKEVSSKMLRQETELTKMREREVKGVSSRFFDRRKKPKSPGKANVEREEEEDCDEEERRSNEEERRRNDDMGELEERIRWLTEDKEREIQDVSAENDRIVAAMRLRSREQEEGVVQLELKEREIEELKERIDEQQQKRLDLERVGAEREGERRQREDEMRGRWTRDVGNLTERIEREEREKAELMKTVDALQTDVSEMNRRCGDILSQHAREGEENAKVTRQLKDEMERRLREKEAEMEAARVQREDEMKMALAETEAAVGGKEKEMEGKLRKKVEEIEARHREEMERRLHENKTEMEATKVQREEEMKMALAETEAAVGGKEKEMEGKLRKKVEEIELRHREEMERRLSEKEAEMEAAKVQRVEEMKMALAETEAAVGGKEKEMEGKLRKKVEEIESRHREEMERRLSEKEAEMEAAKVQRVEEMKMALAETEAAVGGKEKEMEGKLRKKVEEIESRHREEMERRLSEKEAEMEAAKVQREEEMKMALAETEAAVGEKEKEMEGKLRKKVEEIKSRHREEMERRLSEKEAEMEAAKVQRVEEMKMALAETEAAVGGKEKEMEGKLRKKVEEIESRHREEMERRLSEKEAEMEAAKVQREEEMKMALAETEAAVGGKEKEMEGKLRKKVEEIESRHREEMDAKLREKEKEAEETRLRCEEEARSQAEELKRRVDRVEAKLKEKEAEEEATERRVRDKEREIEELRRLRAAELEEGLRRARTDLERENEAEQRLQEKEREIEEAGEKLEEREREMKALREREREREDAHWGRGAELERRLGEKLREVEALERRATRAEGQLREREERESVDRSAREEAARRLRESAAEMEEKLRESEEREARLREKEREVGEVERRLRETGGKLREAEAELEEVKLRTDAREVEWRDGQRARDERGENEIKKLTEIVESKTREVAQAERLVARREKEIEEERERLANQLREIERRMRESDEDKTSAIAELERRHAEWARRKDAEAVETLREKETELGGLRRRDGDNERENVHLRQTIEQTRSELKSLTVRMERETTAMIQGYEEEIGRRDENAESAAREKAIASSRFEQMEGESKRLREANEKMRTEMDDLRQRCEEREEEGHAARRADIERREAEVRELARRREEQVKTVEFSLQNLLSEREGEIAALKEANDTLQGAAEKMKERENELLNERREREEELSKRERAMEARGQEQARVREQLGNKGLELEKKDEEAAKREGALDNRERDVRKREANLEMNRRQGEEMERDARRRRDELLGREQNIERKEGELENCLQALETKQEELIAHGHDIQTKIKELRAWGKGLEERESHLRNGERELANWWTESEKQSERMKCEQEEVSAMGEELSRLQQELRSGRKGAKDTVGKLRKWQEMLERREAELHERERSCGSEEKEARADGDRYSGEYEVDAGEGGRPASNNGVHGKSFRSESTAVFDDSPGTTGDAHAMYRQAGVGEGGVGEGGEEGGKESRCSRGSEEREDRRVAAGLCDDGDSDRWFETLGEVETRGGEVGQKIKERGAEERKGKKEGGRGGEEREDAKVVRHVKLLSSGPSGQGQRAANIKESELRVVVLGETGSSLRPATGTILGGEATRAGGATPAPWRGQIAGRRVRLVEPAGLRWRSGADATDAVQAKSVLDSVSLVHPGPHALLLVIPAYMTFTPRYRRAVESHMGLLGEGIWRRTLVLFTWGEALAESAAQHVLRNGDLTWLVEKCGGRYHLLTGEGDHALTQGLFEKIEEMVAVNHGDGSFV